MVPHEYVAFTLLGSERLKAVIGMKIGDGMGEEFYLGLFIICI